MFPKAVLFDLDNTLTHRARSIDTYAQRFLLDHDSQLDAATSAEVAALIKRQDNGGYLAPSSPHPSIAVAVASSLHAELRWRSPVAIAALAWHWREHFPRQSIEMPGAHALVSALSGHGVKIAIISNGADRTRRMTLENLSFKEHIGLLVSSEAAGREKPDPSIFLHTARQLDLSPAQCVYIGDHPLNDVTGAAAAGMRSIWLSGFHPWPEHLPAPAASVASLEDVLSLLGEFPPAIAQVDEGQASTPATTT